MRVRFGGAPVVQRARVKRLEYVLPEGGAELVEDLEHVEDDVQLDHRLVAYGS